MKTNLLLTFCVCVLLSSFAQAQFPAAQSWESAPSDNWVFTISPTTYNVSGDIWDIVTSVGGTVNGPSDGNNFFGMLDLNNPNGGGAFRHTLTSDPINISGQSNVQISFDYNADGYDSTDSLMYEIFYDGVGQGLILLANNQGGGNTGGWQTETHNITGTPTNVHIVVSAFQNGSDYAGVDNFSIMSTGGSSCVAPSNIQAYNIMSTSASIDWVAGNGTPQGWEVSVVLSGNNPVGGTSSGFTGHQANGLTAGTNYDVYVREICSGGDTSSWAGPTMFSTPAASVFPAAQSFESMPSDNWNFTANPSAYNEAGGTDIWEVSSSVGGTVNNASDGNNFWGILDINNSGSGGAFRHTLTFAPINISGQSNVQISFDYNADGYDSTDSLMYEIFYDGVGQGLVLLANNQGGGNTGGWQTEIHNVTGTPTNVHIVVSAVQNGSDYAGVDNFNIASPPACSTYPALASSSLIFSNTTATNTTLNWTSGDGNNRIIVARQGSAVNFTPNDSSTYTANANFGSGQDLGNNQYVVYNGNGNMVNLTGLAAGTDYHFAIFEYNCTTGSELYFSTSAIANVTTNTVPKIAITEFIVNPIAPDADAEWVEIYNYGTTPVDLNGWTVEDEGTDNASIASSSLIIPAGGFKILTTNKTFFETEWFGGTPNTDIIEVSGNMLFSNSADEIILKDNSGATVWAVAYGNDDANGNATFLTYAETIGNTIAWGNSATPGINRNGTDPASSSLGYESNNNTTDIAAYTALSGDLASPLRNDLSVALHVDINANGNNDGSSWANAFNSLQDAINAANTNGLILVAQGTYLPTEDTSGATTTGRTATFYLNKDIVIQGGYPTGGGTQNPMMNPTILSGDLGTMGDASDNAYHVLWLEGLSSATKIEGLHIQDGNANGTNFIDDWGAGIYNIGVGNGNSSNPTVQNCIVRWNNANYMGGGLLNNSSNGGETSPMIVGCLFYENTANVGGAIGNTTYNGGTNTMLVSNCTFADNTGTGASIYGRNGNANITVQNSVLWDAKAIRNNTANNEFMVSYSLVATNNLGAADAGNNILTFQGQVFADAANDDYTLFASSLAIDNGSNGLVAAGYTMDLAGNNRVSNGIVDLGALEKLSVAMLYVNQAATGNNNGSSWADAYTDLQAALQQAGAGTEIWIASGTYTPTAGTDRSVSFEIGSGVKIYGGFAGGETSLTQRNWSANTTILSGDIGVMSDATDNSYHVVTLKNGANTTLLDGLVIQEGNADGTAYVDDWGAGILNDGSGAGGMSSPTLMNCILRWNHANYLGGAILNNGGNGGETSPMIVGCLFYENTANTGGGAIGNITFKGGSNNMVITNSTFADNTGLGASLYNRNGNANVTVQNSILWDINPIYNFANETTVQYSSVMGASLASGTTNGGNNQLATDPLFVDAANDDYSLQATSPAIASGNNAYLPAGYTMDLANNARQNGATVELGCYEDGASAARPDLAKAETASNTATAEQSMSIEEEMDGSNLASENAASMTVYPNPVQDIVHVNLKDVNQGATVRLLNVTGQVLQQEEIQADAQTVVQLNMGRLSSGVYLLSVQLENGNVLNEKIIRR